MAITSPTGQRRPRPLGRIQAASRNGVDAATIIGLIAAFLLLGTATYLSSTPAAFYNTSAIIIVFGGTAAVTLICFSLTDTANTMRVLGEAFFDPRPDPETSARMGLQFARDARRGGALSLQPNLRQLDQRDFLYRSFSLVMDGMPADEIERLLTQERASHFARHNRAIELLRRAAEFAPAIGLIGTLVGLIQMLGTLSDPSKIGPGMAVALLTTFYGAILSTMVLSPLAAKLERRGEDAALMHKIYMLTVLSISRQENPRRLEMLLNAELPPWQRVQVFD